MKVSKKILSIVLAVIMLITFMPMTNVFAADVVASGTCGANGDNLTWTLDKEGTLTISGEGKIKSYYVDDGEYVYPVYPPWYYERNSIKKVIIENGITEIGCSAFYNCNNLTSVTIGDGVTSILSNAFGNCENLEGILGGNNIKIFGLYSFDNCPNLKYGPCGKNVYWNLNDGIFTVSGNGKMLEGGRSIGTASQHDEDDEYASYFMWFSSRDSIHHVVIENGVTNVGSSAFYGCHFLEDVTLANSVISIGQNAFAYCTNLSSISFTENIRLIEENAFSCCKNIKDVYFTGTNVQWKNISILADNEDLLNANINFDHEHVYECINIPATCTEKGTVIHFCTCGDSYSERTPALGHTDENNDGICDVCSEQIITLPAHVHSYVPSVTTAPTCKTVGERTFTCSCGESYTETIPATGHSDSNNDNVCDSCGENLGGSSDNGNSTSSNKFIEFIRMILDWVRSLFIKK